MAADNASAWDRIADWYLDAVKLPTDVVHYGPDGPTEAELRLLGDVRGRRALELGCGGGHNAIVLAKQGARAIAVDASAEMLAHARRLADAEGVKVEFHHGEMAELAFLTTASVDLVVSATALNEVEDLARVFRQVHRVLKPDAPFVFSVPHPTRLLVDADSDQPLLVRRSYFDRTPIPRVVAGVTLADHPHSVSELFTGLARTNFRVDVLLEPEPAAGATHSPLAREVDRALPPLLVVRARKLGV